MVTLRGEAEVLKLPNQNLWNEKERRMDDELQKVLTAESVYLFSRHVAIDRASASSVR